MEIGKPGSVGFGAPILEPSGAGGAPGAGGPGGAGGKFAEVLQGGGQPQGQAEVRSPFGAPILDAEPMRRPQEVGRKRVASLDAEMKAGGHRRPPTLQATGERAGVAPGGVEANKAPLDFRQVANSTMKAESRIDAMIDAARRGKTFTPGELLGLQMEVFRYQQTVEVISKSTEKVVGGIKQTLGTQV